jgi:Domain of unknown function (DUF4160)
MSRVENLENRLREIILQFGRLLRAELTAIAAGGSSRYLTRKTSPHVFDGRFWSTDETDRLERLEDEIRSLGSKLSADRNEPVHVHVERDASRVKFWLDPVRLARSGGFTPAELRHP